MLGGSVTVSGYAPTKEGLGAPDRMVVRRVIAPCLLRGLLPLPHLGEWMQEGQPESQGQDWIAWRVACNQSLAAW